MVFKINVYNTYFTIQSDDPGKIKSILDPLLHNLKSYKFEFHRKLKRMIKVHDKDFFFIDPRDRKIYLPISTLANVAKDLQINGLELNHSNVSFETDIPIRSLTFKINDKYKPRDYQKLYIDAITGESSPRFTLIDLKPGAGKTFISMVAVSKLKMKVGIVILPKYIEKWIGDVLEYTNIPKSRIFVVQGGQSLNDLLRDPDSYDIVIFSMRTLYLFNKAYEDGSRTPVRPWELFNKLSIGVLLSDESHQELAALSKIIMYSNVRKVIGLSATFISNQADERKLQELVFPHDCRVSNLVKFDKYIDVIAVRYDISTHVKIKDGTGQGYNHMLFEQSLMKQRELFINYLKMVDFYVNNGYITEKQNGEKCIVYFATIDGCTRATKFFQDKYPELVVKRYVGEDDYNEMMKGDIIVSTIGSLGTALDVPRLICVVNTVSIGSPKSNVQVTGRLRKIEGRDVRYYYLYCLRNKSHLKLNKQREIAIDHMARTYRKIDYMEKLIPVGDDGSKLFD